MSLSHLPDLVANAFDDLAHWLDRRSGARLRDPHIVDIYDVGEHEGQPFLVLEFCAGGSLEKKLAGQPLPPRSAAELVETLARAMQHAHQCGIIHRALVSGSGFGTFRL